MGWKPKMVLLGGLLLIVAGCTQQCFVREGDIEHYRKLMPALMERDPKLSAPPGKIDVFGPPPVTVLNPETREPYYMSLQEAIAIALESGTVGVQSVRQPGNIPDDLIFVGQLPQIQLAVDSIRVLALAPAVQAAGIEASVSKFDVKAVTQMLWSRTDQQVQGLGSFQNGERAHFETGLYKFLPTGGLVGTTFSTDYTNLDQPPQAFQIQNPAYLARVDFIFEQPLLQGFGVDINQLLGRHPGASPGSSLTGPAQSFLGGHLGSVAQGLSAGFGTDGILIARLRFDQSRAEFERFLNYQMLNVETAYWNLYATYVDLYAAEQGLRMAHAVWARYKAIKDAGGGKEFKPYFEDRARGQYHLFSGDRTQALGRVLENERILRALLGLKADDGKQLIPIDAPTLAPYHPDWQTALEETLNLRPELVAAREELKIRQFDIEIQKNFLKPDLRFVSRYGASGLGSRLDGDGAAFDASTQQFRPNNAFRNLAMGNFSDWNLGLTLNVPLGYRFEHASIRRSRLALAQAFWAVKNEERKAESALTKAYRDIFDTYKQIKDRKGQRVGFANALESLVNLVKGEALVIGSEEIFQAQRDYVNALRQEAQAVASYNNALAAFQFAKGTLMRHNNVVVNEGELPKCAQVRAVEHERERSKALLLRERALSVHAPAGDGLDMPRIPEFVAPSVPALLEGAAPVQPIAPPEVLPTPAPKTKNQYPVLEHSAAKAPASQGKQMWTSGDSQDPPPALPKMGSTVPLSSGSSSSTGKGVMPVSGGSSWSLMPSSSVTPSTK